MATRNKILAAAAAVFGGLCVMAAEKPAAMASDDWNPAVLMQGDVLHIEVFRVSEFSRDARIEDDGTFTYPLCGIIPAAGKTPREIAKVMAEKLAMQVADPQVEVTVAQWAPRRVYVLGEVKSNSALQVPSYGRMTVLQAISEAGGVTEKADLSHVTVLRRNTVNGVSTIVRHKVDVSVLASSSDGGVVQDFRLQPDDTLVVPKAEPVFVTGKIEDNVLYINTERPPMLSELVVRCGGVALGANISNIEILRKKDDGTMEIIVASLRPVPKGPYEKDIRVKPGDYIMVPAEEQIYVLGEVHKPGPLTLPPNKKIKASQAVALAGGFTSMARKGKVTLIRDGQMSFIDLSSLYDDVANMKRDVPIYPGDILYVRESFW